MLENYSIFRCVLDPRVFENGAFHPASLLKLEKVHATEEKYVISVSFLERFEDLGSTHEYGVRVATAANAFMIAQGRALSADEIVQYIGHYQMRYGSIQKRCWQHHSVSFKWCPEGNLSEHCEIEVNWNGDLNGSSKKSRTRERGEIVEWLFEIIFGPNRFQDPAGRDVSNVDLPVIAERPAA